MAGRSAGAGGGLGGAAGAVRDGPFPQGRAAAPASAQTIHTEDRGTSQQEKPNAPEQPEDPEDEEPPEEPEEPETPEQPDEEEPDAPEQPENPTDNPGSRSSPAIIRSPVITPAKGITTGPARKTGTGPF